MATFFLSERISLAAKSLFDYKYKRVGFYVKNNQGSNTSETASARQGVSKLAWRLDLIFAFAGGNLALPFSATPLRAAAGNPGALGIFAREARLIGGSSPDWGKLA